MKKNTLKKILGALALTLMLGVGVSTVSNFTTNADVAKANNMITTETKYEKIPYNEEMARELNIKDEAQWDRLYKAEVAVNKAFKEARGQKAVNDIFHGLTDYELEEGVITAEEARLSHIYIDAKDGAEAREAYENLKEYVTRTGSSMRRYQ